MPPRFASVNSEGRALQSSPSDLCPCPSPHAHCNTSQTGRNGIMLECVVSNVPAGVCFVMTGSNVAFEVVQFDDGIKDKQRLLALQKKAKHEEIALDKLRHLEADAEHALSQHDTPTALEHISQALIESSNAGEAGATRAAELEVLLCDVRVEKAPSTRQTLWR